MEIDSVVLLPRNRCGVTVGEYEVVMTRKQALSQKEFAIKFLNKADRIWPHISGFRRRMEKMLSEATDVSIVRAINAFFAEHATNTPADIFKGKALRSEHIVRFRFSDVKAYLEAQGVILRQSELATALEGLGARRMGNTMIAGRQVRPWAIAVSKC